MIRSKHTKSVPILLLVFFSVFATLSPFSMATTESHCQPMKTSESHTLSTPTAIHERQLDHCTTMILGQTLGETSSPDCQNDTCQCVHFYLITKLNFEPTSLSVVTSFSPLHTKPTLANRSLFRPPRS